MPCHGGKFNNKKTCVRQHLDLATTDAVITASEVAYDLENILDETLQTTVFSVFFGDTIITSCEVKNSSDSYLQDVESKFLTDVLFRFYEPTVCVFFLLRH